jgi:ABC-type phosphate transport system permease subunit
MGEATAQREAGPASLEVRSILRGRRMDVRGIAFEAVLLVALLLALAVLVTLLADVIIQAVPVFEERGAEFLTSNLSSVPSRASARPSTSRSTRATTDSPG